jgi:hypothetical protein
MWLDNPEVVAKIESRDLDFRNFMKNPENQKAEPVGRTSHKFDKPTYLEKKLKEVEMQVKHSQERHQKDKEFFLSKISEAK